MTKGGWRSSIALIFGVAGKERRVNLRGWVYGQGQGEEARGEERKMTEVVRG